MLIILVSILSGIISGMGIGGGTILIPALILFFNISQQSAQGVNLISFIPTASVAIIAHLKNKNILGKLSLLLIIGGLCGAILGSMLASSISSPVLRKLFGIFLLFMGLYEILSKAKK